MEMINVKSERTVKFEDIKNGQPFIDNVGNLYMKFIPTCDASDADNAVNLNSGYGCMFDDEEDITLADARVVIMNRG